MFTDSEGRRHIWDDELHTSWAYWENNRDWDRYESGEIGRPEARMVLNCFKGEYRITYRNGFAIVDDDGILLKLVKDGKMEYDADSGADE